MEKQKIFWVILSVTVFIVVVLVVGLVLLKQGPSGVAASRRSGAPSAAAPAPSAVSPSVTAPSTTAPGTAPSTTAPSGGTTAPSGIYEFGRDPSSAEGDTEVLRFVIGGETGTSPVGGSAGTASGAQPAPALPSASSTAAKPAAPAATKPIAPSAAKPAVTAPSAAKPATASAAQYWIQTGSYKSQTRAEELSQSLAAKGLAGRVFAYEKTGETYFRVRIGPYTNKQEAEKFLAIVRHIEGLESSYISLVPGARSLY